MEYRDTKPRDALDIFSLSVVFLVTVILIVGMIVDRKSVTLSIVCGIGFFAVFGGFVISILSGQLTEMVINHQNQKTVRIFNKMQFELYQQEAPQLVTELPQLVAEVPQMAQIPSFVPAVPKVGEHLKISTYEFVMGLYKDGAPDPERILPEGSKRPGQVQAKKPRPEVVDYLLALGMVRIDEETRMMFFNVNKYPTLRECQQSIKHGVPVGG